MTRSRFSPFGRVLWNKALDAGYDSQEEFAAALRRHGYSGRQGGFGQTALSHLLRAPDPRVGPSFWRAARRALRLSDEEMMELFNVYERMGQDGDGS